MKTRVPLLEVFSTFQGEGPRVGTREIFVRLAKCDLRCAFCDTPESFPTPGHATVEVEPGGDRHASLENPVLVDDIVAALERIDDPSGLHESISITGGEPLLHPKAVREIAVGARRLGLDVHVETGGHRPDALRSVLDVVDAVSPDLKLESACGQPTRWDAHAETYRMLDQAGCALAIKAVVCEATPIAEIERAAAFCAEHLRTAPLVLQPVTPYGDGPVAPTTAHLFRLHGAASRVHPDVRVIPQVHRFLGVR